MSSNYTHPTNAKRYLVLARQQPIRETRDEYLDIALAFLEAAEAGTALARAADNVRDERRVKELERRYRQKVAALPLPEDDPEMLSA
jgi:hypothetical protein